MKKIKKFFFDSISLPLLVSAKDGMMVAIAGTRYVKTKKEQHRFTGSLEHREENVGLVVKYFNAKQNADWKKDVFTDKNWKMQLAKKGDSNNKFYTTRTFVVNAAGDEIYVFSLKITNGSSTQRWDFKMAKGTVSGTKENKKIAWTTTEITDYEHVKDKMKNLNEKTLGLAAAKGFAFLIDDKKIVFVVKGKSFDETKKCYRFCSVKRNRK